MWAGTGMSSSKDVLLDGTPYLAGNLSYSCCRDCLSDLPSSVLLCRETLVPRQTARATS